MPPYGKRIIELIEKSRNPTKSKKLEGFKKDEERRGKK